MNIKKLLDKKESGFLFESLSRLAGINPWLGVIDDEGRLLVSYPEKESQPAIEEIPQFQERLSQKSCWEADGYIYLPLILGDTCIGSLVGKGSEKDSLSRLLALLSDLLVKQIKRKIEKKAILRETLDSYKEINLLYNIGDSIGSSLDVEHLARNVLQEGGKIIKCEGNSLMLLNPETGILEIKSTLVAIENNRVELKLGQGIAGIAAQEARYVISNDVSQDHRFIPGENIRSLLCVPLKTKRKVLGVINLRNKLSGEMFTARDAKLISALASQAANFIENAILHEQKMNEDRLKRNFERYLSPHIVKNLMESNRELELGGVKKTVAVLFADIRKFTTLSEEMEPESLVSFLNEYFTRMVDIVFKYGGTVDKFVGDEIIAVFGAPISQADDEVRAVKAAVEMQQEMQRLRHSWRERDMQPVFIGIGINSGEVIAGNIGSKRHMDYTVIGDVVNTAKRLETEAAGDKIMVSRKIQAVNRERYTFKDVGKIFVKGKKKPVEIFEVIY